MPQYSMSAADAAKKTAFFNGMVEEIAGCTTDGMTDFEKVLAVHDYFVLHYEYDLTYSNYSALSIFENQTGVCQAYALGFMAVMKRLGIPCSMVTSDEMGHAWNMVRLGDSYYHVDVTWDDPINDRIGRVLHRFLLLDDETIGSDSIHYGWSAPAEAQDGSYANSFLTDVTSPFVYGDGKWYYIDGDGDTLVYGLTQDLNERTDQYRYALKNPQVDVDGDGLVTVSDAVWILSFLVERNTPTTEQQSYADITGDGLVTIADAVRVLETAAQSD